MPLFCASRLALTRYLVRSMIRHKPTSRLTANSVEPAPLVSSLDAGDSHREPMERSFCRSSRRGNCSTRLRFEGPVWRVERPYPPPSDERLQRPTTRLWKSRSAFRPRGRSRSTPCIGVIQVKVIALSFIDGDACFMRCGLPRSLSKTTARIGRIQSVLDPIPDRCSNRSIRNKQMSPTESRGWMLKAGGGLTGRSANRYGNANRFTSLGEDRGWLGLAKVKAMGRRPVHPGGRESDGNGW
ncbi:hypothetical protein AWB68_00852 [Caballeronia choica]|uniref:Uncharacterized protein n=1 Tax=Caballeronia choica TaxID=326476 RepID=A0A158FPQ3_9BURK|nr:hypothetical protein AWB68_00852 [Caballeronia choica]